MLLVQEDLVVQMELDLLVDYMEVEEELLMTIPRPQVVPVDKELFIFLILQDKIY
jgi:hypothetical protein